MSKTPPCNHSCTVPHEPCAENPQIRPTTPEMPKANSFGRVVMIVRYGRQRIDLGARHEHRPAPVGDQQRAEHGSAHEHDRDHEQDQPGEDLGGKTLRVTRPR